MDTSNNEDTFPKADTSPRCWPFCQTTAKMLLDRGQLHGPRQTAQQSGPWVHVTEAQGLSWWWRAFGLLMALFVLEQNVQNLLYIAGMQPDRGTIGFVSRPVDARRLLMATLGE